MAATPGRLLRSVAWLLVRGPAAPYVLGDLDEAWRRDIERGHRRTHASRRYLVNVLGSAWSLTRARLPVVPRGVPSPGAYWLDVKLGLRMLLKYPGLTAVAVFALALGIPASLAPVHLLNMLGAPLPFEEGDRIVGLRHRSLSDWRVPPGSAHEYAVWRGSLSSFTAVGAARADRYNIIAADGRAAPWRGAQVSASSFAILRVPPLLGRPLVEADEAPGAPDVVVIGHELWQSFFDGDRAAVGRTLRIGGTPHTVVGVMPRGFLFPLNDALWLPLRIDPLASEPATGAPLWIFGRLADGVSQAQALAELSGVQTRLAQSFPDTYASLRAEIVPYTNLIMRDEAADGRTIAPFQLFALLLLAVACGNVGTLIMARTATRSDEVALRTALGASRARIVTQFFIESLVLALLATGLGLALMELAGNALGRMLAILELPFWLDFGLNPRTVALALVLAVFSSVLAGVLPALKATGQGIQGNLRRRGAAGARFGRATTALIVVQVALGVGCLFAGAVRYRVIPTSSAQIGMPLEQYLSAYLSLAGPAQPGGSAVPDAAAERARLAAVQQELARRLAAEPDVRGVAMAGILPGQNHPVVRVELEAGSAGDVTRSHLVKHARVQPGFFEGLGQPILRGRDFVAADLPAVADEAGTAVIVNTAFVERVLGGRDPIGLRIRYAAAGDAEPEPWYEIVGVVGRAGMINLFAFTPDEAGLYHPVAPGAISPVRMAVHVRGHPAAFGPRLRAIAAELDPDAMIERPMLLSEIVATNSSVMHWLLLVFAIAGGIAVTLSVAGLYALMSFTVAQRTHEIGVRAALGAHPTRIVTVIAQRALAQLAVGILIAVLACAAFVLAVIPEPSLTMKAWPAVLGGAAGAVFLVGTLACVAPTLRGLRVRPMEALRL